jgi:hypothetical protein
MICSLGRATGVRPETEGDPRMTIGPKGKAIGTVLASCALVLGISTSASATTKLYAGDAGYAEWNADPDGNTPGDAIRACDTESDGWDVKAVLQLADSSLRTASTAGHTNGYCTSWKTGDLREDDKFLLTVYKVKDAEEVIIDFKIVTA